MSARDGWRRLLSCSPDRQRWTVPRPLLPVATCLTFGLLLAVLAQPRGMGAAGEDPLPLDPLPAGTPMRPGIPGVTPDSIPGTTAGLPPTATMPDKTRRDFNPNCFESGCHAQRREARWLHGPIAIGACQACHVEDGPPEKHRYKPTRTKEELCVPCHKPREPRQVRHDPFVKSECVKCHSPHGGEDKAFLLEPTLALLCVRCHDGQEHDGKVIAAGPREVAFPHEPAKKGDCVGCHRSHQSDHEKLLVRDKKLELCIGCHRELIPSARAADGQAAGFRIPEPLPVDTTFAEVGLLVPDEIPSPPPPDSVFYHVTGPIWGQPFLEAAPAESVGSVVAQLLVVHKPLTEDCHACHPPHGSDIKDMLRDQPRKLCDSCHLEKMTKRVADARSDHGQAYEKEAESCSQCHTDHASRFAHLLARSSRELCLDCHDEAIRVDEERELPDIRAQLTGAMTIHEPIEQGCVACHWSHAGREQKLLRARYPETNYIPYATDAYALCFVCHERARIEEEFSTTTGFRNGDRNLHYLHTHAEKGRTCGNCHEAHGSPRPRLVSESISFGPSGWPLPIEFEKTETGGACSAGCHRRLAYDRVTPVELQPGERP